MAIPIAKAPTIGDRPAKAAIPAAPKNAAVVIPSTLPLDFHSLSEWRSLGIKNTAPTSIAANIPSTWSMSSTMSVIAGMAAVAAPSPPCTMDTTTESTAMASMSSTMAAPSIRRASFDCILPISDSTWMDIAMLVAVSAVATSKDSSASRPNVIKT
jgi:hypothetical protein